MAKRNAAIVAILAAAVAIFYGTLFVSNEAPPQQWRSGRNNTVLFITNADYGLSNVHLATAHSLLLNHPEVEVHYASHAKWEKRLSELSRRASQEAGEERNIRFHLVPGTSFADAIQLAAPELMSITNHLHRPGLESVRFWQKTMNAANMPWEAEEYLGIYRAIRETIETIDASIVVLETNMPPALHAVRDLQRKYAILTPNFYKDIIGHFQPRGSILWKYPTIGTGFTFPVPWRLIPTNAYIMLRIAYEVIFSPKYLAVKAFLRAQGVTDPIRIDQLYQPDVPIITQCTPEADYPMSFMPDKLISTGPIFLSSAPAAQQDAELASWIAQKPTVLINLGSHIDYDEEATKAMVKAIRFVLDRVDVQFLWKYNERVEGVQPYFQDREEPIPEALFGPLSKEIGSGRLRLVHWISTEPSALLETGHIVASVHHGGANCFFEALGTGVPQIVLPVWADCFDVAVRAEYIGVGVYGARNSSPFWDGDELAQSFLEVLENSEKSRSIRARAKEMAGSSTETGRHVAAREIAVLARSGDASN